MRSFKNSCHFFFVASDTSSSETSSLTSDSSSEDSDEEDDIDDTRLMLEIRKKFQKIDAAARKRFKSDSRPAKKASPNLALDAGGLASNDSSAHSSLDERLRAEFQLDSTSDGSPPTKKRRSGLVTEVHIISVGTCIFFLYSDIYV